MYCPAVQTPLSVILLTVVTHILRCLGNTLSTGFWQDPAKLSLVDGEQVQLLQ